MDYFKNRKTYAETTIEQYIAELSSKEPIPGGGSVAALMGALAAGLICKVANFTVGKKEFSEAEEEMVNIRNRAEELNAYFKRLCSEDANAYKKLSEVFKMPKGEDRTKKMQEALKSAINVPLEVCRYAHEAMKFCLPLAQRGNRNLITDAGIAGLLLKSAFRSALFNVEINLKYIKNPDTILKAARTLEPMEENINTISEDLITEVESYLAK